MVLTVSSWKRPFLSAEVNWALSDIDLGKRVLFRYLAVFIAD
jgi:hypothetical protein